MELVYSYNPRVHIGQTTQELTTRDALVRHWPTQTIGRLSINTKSYKNLTFLPSDIETKLSMVIPALRVTVKPALGYHPFVKLKVVAKKQVVAQ